VKNQETFTDEISRETAVFILIHSAAS